MRNIKLQIEYDGTNYCGWQVQNRRPYSVFRRPSIQGAIEKTLQKILPEKIRLIASGRTDAGVHALAQVANFKTHSHIALEKMQRSLNSLLPDDIKINRIEEAGLDFHSRFCAKSKVYRYSILNSKYPSALLRNWVYFYPHSLNIKLMQREARCLLGRHDFKAFCASASASDTKDTTRTIKRITVKKAFSEPRTMPAVGWSACGGNYAQKNGELIIIDIEADGFLYNMVRNIVGTLIEIGRGKFPKGSLKEILLSKSRKSAGPTVPAKGLSLIKVKY